MSITARKAARVSGSSLSGSASATSQARRAGMPDVFAHGMLGMAWLGRVVTAWAPQSQLRKFDARFQGITHLGNAMRCSGRVIEKLEHNGEQCVRIELSSSNQFG